MGSTIEVEWSCTAETITWCWSWTSIASHARITFICYTISYIAVWANTNARIIKGIKELRSRARSTSRHCSWASETRRIAGAYFVWYSISCSTCCASWITTGKTILSTIANHNEKLSDAIGFILWILIDTCINQHIHCSGRVSYICINLSNGISIVNSANQCPIWCRLNIRSPGSSINIKIYSFAIPCIDLHNFETYSHRRVRSQARKCFSYGSSCSS